MGIPSLVAELRSHAGEESVQSRARGEENARRLLDERAGRFSADEAWKLGWEANTSFWHGSETHARFMPAFTGGIWTSLLRDMPGFNDFTLRMWRATEEEALDLLGSVLANHRVLPYSAPSFPSLLMYLRNPDAYLVALPALATGLSRMTGSRYRLDGEGAYLAYCRDGHALGRENGLAPQEIDLAMWGATESGFCEYLDLDEAGAEPPSVAEDFELWTIARERAASRQPAAVVSARAASADPTPRRVSVAGTAYIRDPYVAAEAKRLANGICDLCGERAPFQGPDGSYYLEAHHVKWLARGGTDSVRNVVGLCPNCHRRMHVLDREDDVRSLQSRIGQREV